MTCFVECSIPEIKYLRGDKIVNHAVNISLCTSLRKSKVKWYPDNVGRASLVFVGCNTEWAFMSDEERDAEYKRLLKCLNNQNNKLEQVSK